MNICELRHVPDNALPYFGVTGDLLSLTVKPDDVVVCAHCPNIHVRVQGDLTVARVRMLAKQFSVLADTMERQR